PGCRGRRLSALDHALSPPTPAWRRGNRHRRLLAPAVARARLPAPRLFRRRRPALRTPAAARRRDRLAETEAGMKRIWLTGASSGIAAALAEEVLGAGQRLALSARSGGRLQAFAARYGEQVLVAPGVLAVAEQVRAIGQRIAQRWGALDCAILN